MDQFPVLLRKDRRPIRYLVVDDSVFARKNVAKSRLALRLAMPLQQHSGRNFDVPAKLFRGMPTQKQAVEEGRFALRKVEVVQSFFGPLSGGGCRRVGFSVHEL